ncbi:SDR family NAD(P)-dependent oxidoreductase [Novosphingobium sp. LASN5T]|uniref:SDR family NAD(P)-dependent oxidoreductase n=1 Tax=Novosphingobium sp. LASN5T TaxID=2491021 RepID=UPI000F5FF452|nr:SDR family NAD(P)-dependent oxidoreductase [Novosphingobium sp. LASN5T]RQW41740.1 SDR family NAD(P)-dependent oxidoreductase [Novosphingobium sp. LASN5T]
MGQLEGRRALVTGAADGIGRAIAEAFAREGAQVLAIDVSGEKLNAAFARDAAIVPIVQDITATDAAEVLIAKSGELLCGLDILVNNAGIPGELALLEETTDV